MEYEGQICRGPGERGSYMLPVSVGCPYNRCRFCDLFTHLTYRELPLDKIENELKRVKSINGKPDKIFLGDGSAFSLRAERLIAILEMIGRYFPEVSEINCDATITSIKAKTDEELKRLSDLKLSTLYIGIESGLDDVLTFMNKEHNLKEAYEEIERIRKAGMNYAAHIMTGVAGSGRGAENAIATAAFINRTEPLNIVNFSMFLTSEALRESMARGEFRPASELENLEEEKILIENINLENGRSIRYDSFHDWIHIRFSGKLPDDREKLLKAVERKTEELNKIAPVYSNRELTEKEGHDPAEFGFNDREYIGLEDVYVGGK